MMFAPREYATSHPSGGKLLEPVKHGGDHAARLAVRHPIDLAGIAGPIAQLLLGVVGKRAHHGDALARA